MNPTTKFRNNSVMLSEEVLFYLKLKARQVVEGTDANITIDQLSDSILRKELTDEYPEFIELWAEMEEAKQRAIKEYRAIEGKAGRVVA